MALNWKKVAVGTLITLAAIGAVNHFRLNTHANEAMEYREADVLAYYRFGFLPTTIVFDIRGVETGNSAAATIGGLIEFADSLSERRFDKVILAWRGKSRFILDGDDFQSMGRSASYQNPVYTVRTLPEKLRRPDGTLAFSTWSGGAIGVLGQQMEDVNRFAREWYVNDALSGF
jgi:hypothetical protein